LVQATYVTGANPLAEGQTTRISVTYEVRNPLNVALDFNGTVVFDMGPSTSNTTATATAGTTNVMGRRVNWDGFVLNPGQSASITISTDVTPPPGSGGGAVVVIEGSLASARTPTGGIVSVRGGALTSDLISGLANGGLVTVRAPIAPGQPGVGGATVTAVQVAPGAAPAGVTTLPRTGTGLTAERGTTLGIWLGLGVSLFLAGAAGSIALARRRR
jgi:hypothetical protein